MVSEWRCRSKRSKGMVVALRNCDGDIWRWQSWRNERSTIFRQIEAGNIDPYATTAAQIVTFFIFVPATGILCLVDNRGNRPAPRAWVKANCRI